MSDKLFAECCFGTESRHASYDPCPFETGRIMETEANIFAAHLLMPEQFLSQYLKKDPMCIEDDNWVERCAKKFKVPKGLVIFRLMVASS